MQINLTAPAATPAAPSMTLDLRLNRDSDGTPILEARGTDEFGTSTGWAPVLTFPTGKDDGLLRMRRATNLTGPISSFINTGGGNDSILMIRNDDR
jgi:hypothetical protein